jgi:hypothetical protein
LPFKTQRKKPTKIMGIYNERKDAHEEKFPM